MTLDELKEMYLYEMKISSEDYCSRCAYNSTKQCAMGEMHIIDDKKLETVFDNPDGFGSDQCLWGLYEYYKANKKGAI